MSRLRKLIVSEKAAVLPMTALMVIVLVLLVGVVVDMSRAYTLQNKAQQASDAALLGAVATISTNCPELGLTDPNASDEDKYANKMARLNCEAERLFNSNFPANYLGSDITLIPGTNFRVNEVPRPGSGVYELTFNTKIPLVILKGFGFKDVDFNILSQVKYLPPEFRNNLELTLVLDTTDSMNACPTDPVPGNVTCAGESKLVGLKKAATNFMNILFQDEANRPNVWVSIVPYDMSVNLQNYGKAEWLRTGASIRLPTSNTDPAGEYDFRAAYVNNMNIVDRRNNGGRSPIVATNPNSWYYIFQNRSDIDAESTAADLSEAVPNVTDPKTLFQMARYRYNKSKWPYVPCVYNAPPSPVSPVGECVSVIGKGPVEPTTGTLMQSAFKYASGVQPILARSQNNPTLVRMINNLTAQRATRVPVGLMWGWFTLSPNWKNIWGDTSGPVEYKKERYRKILVLMTDGSNERPGANATNPAGLTDYLYDPARDDRMTEALCRIMKSSDKQIH